MSVATARVFRLRAIVAVLALCALAGFAGQALAQGVTTSAARGRILDQEGQPIVGATVILTAALTGQRFQTVTQTGGRFYITNVPVGQYALEARAIGFRPARDPAVVLSLGQAGEILMRMEAATVELAGVEVRGTQENEIMSQSRTGASQLVTELQMDNLPTLNRNFQDFVATVPQVVPGVGSSSDGVSIGGANNRYNNIQIDGAVNNDLFGLAGSGVPGGQAGSRPISVEAIKEYQVLIAPFDIRQGGFTGGLINAVTQSGTNRWHLTGYGYFQNEGLVGKDSVGNSASDFNQTQYGFTLSGPFVRDRLHFFGNVEVQTREAPFTGVSIRSTDPAGTCAQDSIGTGICRTTADRVTQITRDSLGFDPGDYRSLALETPSLNFFAKLSWQPSANNTFELSYNHVDGYDDKLIRSPAATGFRDGYQLSRSGYQQANNTNRVSLIWRRPFGSRISNEMIVGYQTIRDKRELPNANSLIFVGGDRPFTGSIPAVNVAAGADRFSHGNSLDQNIFEFTDNITWSINDVHTLTFGTHNELFSFRNEFFAGKYGIWSFRDTAQYYARNPFRYEIVLPGATKPEGPTANFSVNQLGFYAQDQITPNRRLTLTFGLRVDIPFMDTPAYNIDLDTSTVLQGPNAGQPFGVDTREFPSGNPLWSPRFGFNYDMRGNGSTILRGGLGVFSGRPPYVWVSNSFVNTGLEQTTLICDGAVSTTSGTTDTVPVFDWDPSDGMPNACVGGAAAAAAVPSVVYFDKNFRLPQTARLALGLDHRLPWNMVGTVDFMYSRYLNAIYLEDINLVPGGISFGEGNRQLYGAYPTTASSTAQPRRQTKATPASADRVARDVILQKNSNEDYAFQLTFQLQKRFSNGLEFNGGYTFARSYDLMTMTSSISNSNLRFAVLDGTLSDRNLRPSAVDVPHSVRFNVTGNLPFRLRGTIQYLGRSGTPYAYVYSNDVNADGLGGNDLAYVPLSSSDIMLATPSQYARLDAFINSEPCLREARGRIMERTSCRNPWQSFVNGQLIWSQPSFSGQRLELSMQMFNVLSFLGVGGQVKETSFFENTNLLTLSRYNHATGRGIYNLAFSESNLRRVNVTASRWRLVLGARYSI